MPNKCAVFGCRTGYRGELNNNISLHSFPHKNVDLMNSWLNRISRDANFIPSKNSRVCSLHFTDDDFVTERHDSNKSRSKKLAEKALPRR